MITLTFSLVSTQAPVFVRAAFFRICADSTLRGPDSTVVAMYVAHVWRLGARGCREFHCSDALYLRVMTEDGQHTKLGPYESVRAAHGALFANGRRVGAHLPTWKGDVQAPCWNEIALLPA